MPSSMPKADLSKERAVYPIWKHQQCEIPYAYKTAARMQSSCWVWPGQARPLDMATACSGQRVLRLLPQHKEDIPGKLYPTITLIKQLEVNYNQMSASQQDRLATARRAWGVSGNNIPQNVRKPSAKFLNQSIPSLSC